MVIVSTVITVATDASLTVPQAPGDMELGVWHHSTIWKEKGYLSLLYMIGYILSSASFPGSREYCGRARERGHLVTGLYRQATLQTTQACHTILTTYALCWMIYLWTLARSQLTCSTIITTTNNNYSGCMCQVSHFAITQSISVQKLTVALGLVELGYHLLSLLLF